MELVRDRLRLQARKMDDEEFEELQASVECQCLSLADITGLLIYHNGNIHCVVRDVDCKYELLDLEYLNEEFELFI